MKSLHSPTAPPGSSSELLAVLSAARLLTDEQTEQWRSRWTSDAEMANDPHRQGRELVEAGLLTPFQMEQILAGHASQLRLGRYRLLDRLGAGGMGQVYKAEHLLMKRVVALKVVARAEDSSADLDALQAAFLREIEVAARLRHPNIVTAFDAAKSGDVLFLVMEYIEGTDLGQLVAEQGPLSVALACEIIRQTAQALQYAYEQGLVHRDIKPSNLLLVRPGTAPSGTTTPLPEGRRPELDVVVKLLDLGLACLTHGPAGTRGARPTVETPGRDMPVPPGPGLVGTPDFMAPECGEHPDHADVRADLYSLGCTFYFLLTGRVPFPGGTWTEKLLRHCLDTPTPIADLRPDVPAAVLAIVNRLLAKKPEDRFATPADLLAVLPLCDRRVATRECTLLPRLDAAATPSDLLAKPTTTFSSSADRRSVRSWLIGLLLASLSGLLLAWGGRWAAQNWLLPRSQAPRGRTTTPTTAFGVPVFVIAGRTTGFGSLADAIHESTNDDVIILHADGPVPTGPIAWRDKTLTLRAAPGRRPGLVMNQPPEHPWQALLTTNRDLTLEGLDLIGPDGIQAEGHLLACDRCSLRLINCRLRATSTSAAIVLRNGAELILHGCRIEAGSLALSVEVGQIERCKIRIANSMIRTELTTGMAMALWSAEARHATAIDLLMERSTLAAGRILAVRAPRSQLSVHAVQNDFSFQEALLSYVETGRADSWRRCTTWQEQDNHYQAQGPWLLIDGRPLEIRDANTWARLWEAQRYEIPDLRDKTK